MDEASTTLIEQVVRTLRRLNIDPRPIFEGLPFTMEDALSRPRVDWESLMVFLESLQSSLGSLDAFISLFEELNRDLPLWQGFAQMSIRPEELVHLAVHYGRGLYTCCEATSEDLPDGRIRMVQEIHASYRASPLFAHASAGLCRGLPRALGLPAAEVETTIAGHRSEFLIRLPPGQRMRGRTSSEFMAMLFSELDRVADVGKVGIWKTPPTTVFRRQATAELKERVARAAAYWDLTPRQAQVLEQLVVGQCNKEIAVTLGCSEPTVERHVTALLEKARTDSRLALVAKFWGARE